MFNNQWSLDFFLCFPSPSSDGKSPKRGPSSQSQEYKKSSGTRYPHIVDVVYIISRFFSVGQCGGPDGDVWGGLRFLGLIGFQRRYERN